MCYAYETLALSGEENFVNCVNAVLEKGEYQLYGYPFGSDKERQTIQAFIKK